MEPIDAWPAAAPLTSGPLFRPRIKGGQVGAAALGAGAVARVFRNLATAAAQHERTSAERPVADIHGQVIAGPMSTQPGRWDCYPRFFKADIRPAAIASPRPVRLPAQFMGSSDPSLTVPVLASAVTGASGSHRATPAVAKPPCLRTCAASVATFRFR